MNILEYMDDASTIERSLMSHASQNKIPINGSIELLPLCNMKCDMCYVRMEHKDMINKGRIRTCDEWLELAKQMQNAGVLFLLLTGGEPLLYSDFKKVYLGLRSLGMILTINTNGTLIDEEWAMFFSKHKPRRINVTLYGSCEETYDKLCHYPQGFQKTINGIKLLKKYNVDVKISCSATQYNAKDIQDIIRIGNELDIPVRVDTYMMPAIRERDKPYEYQSRLDPILAAKMRVASLKSEMDISTFHQYVQQNIFEVEHILPQDGPMKMSCYAGKCSFTINWQGEIRPCVVLNEPCMNVFDNDFRDGWKYIVDEIDKIEMCSDCHKCHLRPVCRTCGACALLESGTFDGKPLYMCEYAKETYRLLKEEYSNEENI